MRNSSTSKTRLSSRPIRHIHNGDIYQGSQPER